MKHRAFIERCLECWFAGASALGLTHHGVAQAGPMPSEARWQSHAGAQQGVPAMKETASWIVGRHPAWGGAVSENDV